MGWMGSLSISASGLQAQQTIMDVISNNIANANTTSTPTGGPYRREMVVLTPGTPITNAPSAGSSFSDWLSAGLSQPSTSQGGGVQVAGIVQDPSPFTSVYDPSNPNAVNGYVQMPNVDVTTEMVDMISASRAYEANVTAFDAGKQMDTDALTLGQ